MPFLASFRLLYSYLFAATICEIYSFTAKTMIGHKSLVSECYHILHIEDGYRYSHDFYEAFMSLFKMHNETMNIWSHLLGFVCVVIAGIITSIDLWQGAHQTQPMELIAFETYLVCAAFCLLMSSIYHWFCCISEDAHDWLLKLDLSGVGLLVSGSFLPGVYYGKFTHIQIYMHVDVYNALSCRLLLYSRNSTTLHGNGCFHSRRWTCCAVV